MSNTEFGFSFGSMEVTRTYLDNKTNVAAISIKTDKTKFSVRATKTGQVRFFDGLGNECELVSKDYLQLIEINKPL